MSAVIIPTRMELQNLKGKIKGAQKGYDLLKKKSDALTLKFRSLLREIRDVKLRVGELTKEAFFSYTEVKFIANDISPTVIQSVGVLPHLLFMKIDNIAGVRVPELTRVQSGSETTDLLGLSRGGQQIQKCKESFSTLLDALIRLAELQTTFTIIDDVLRITNRRVNAMEYVVIPRYKNNIAFVEFSLDENEREEFYRLKKVQEKRKEIKKIEEKERLARFENPEEVKEIQNLIDEETDDDDLLF